MRLTLSITILIIAASASGLAEDYFPPADANGGWRSIQDPAKVRKIAGIDTARLDQAFEYAKRTSQHGGVLVVRHGYLVYERYYGKGNRDANPTMASVGKAYTSIASGIMLHEKRDKIPLGLEQEVFNAQYLPEALPLSDPMKSTIKLGQLLAMSSGMTDGGQGFQKGEVRPTKAAPRDPSLSLDQSALRAAMWCKPGEGYTYSSQSSHVASIVLRHLVGMEMQQYLDEKLAKPMGWGRWGYGTAEHTPGGGNIAVRSTDALRFGYLLLHGGRWGKQQLVPADYVALCARSSPYNPHSPFSLQFEVNQDGHVAGAPRDAWFKSGGGGYGIVMIPSLDMVIYKMAGSDAQYDPQTTKLPMLYKYDGSRDGWKPSVHTQFDDGPIGTDDGLRRLIEMTVAAVIP